MSSMKQFSAMFDITRISERAKSQYLDFWASIKESKLTPLNTLVYRTFAFHEAMAEKILELTAEVEALKAAQSAKAGQVAWRGIWKASESYAAGEFVTDKGALWHVNRTCKGVRPGTDDTFQLAEKSPRRAA